MVIEIMKLVLLAVIALLLGISIWKEKRPVHHAETKPDKDEQDRSRAIDEGFDNIMKYSVRGDDGFGGLK